MRCILYKRITESKLKLERRILFVVSVIKHLTCLHILIFYRFLNFESFVKLFFFLGNVQRYYYVLLRPLNEMHIISSIETLSQLMDPKHLLKSLSYWPYYLINYPHMNMIQTIPPIEHLGSICQKL